LGDDLDLNIAGPRQSNYPGVDDMAYTLITEILQYFSE